MLGNLGYRIDLGVVRIEILLKCEDILGQTLAIAAVVNILAVQKAEYLYDVSERKCACQSVLALLKRRGKLFRKHQKLFFPLTRG